MLANTGAFVDRIYLSHSPVPWNQYNEQARSSFRSDFNKSRLSSFPYSNKVKLLEGVWISEEDQRNHALQTAKKDGMDYLIIQDADEFYLPEDFQKNLEGIRNNPDYPMYRCPWTVFWKTTEYVIQVRDHEGKVNQTVSTCPNFAVNIHWPNISFSSRRLVNQMEDAFMLEGLCLHLAWVLSDEGVLQKISTWGHSHQFDFQKWYRHKWLAWKPETKYIGHITRYNYRAAVPYTGKLPKELEEFEVDSQSYQALNLIEKIDCFFLDGLSFLKVLLSQLKSKIS